MDNLKEKFNKISEIDFPQSLHQRIFEEILFLKFKSALFVISGLLFLNLILSGWRLWVRIINLETIETIGAVLNGFELSIFFLGNLINSLSESVPFISLVIFLINAVLLIYGIRMILRLKKTSLNKAILNKKVVL